MAGRRRRRDTVGGNVEAGCAKCCAYCRISPLGSAVCYSAIIIVIITCVVYLAGSAFSSATEPEDPDGRCSTANINLKIGDGSINSVFVTYLRYTGVIVMFFLVGVCMSCCVCCGCFCGVSNKLKIAAGILLIPTALLIGLYLAWMGLGTYLVVVMDSNLRSKSVCRNIMGYLIMLYIYLLCLIIFMLIIFLWQCWSVVKGKSGPTFSNSTASSSRNAQSTGGGLVGDSVKLMSVV